MFIDSCFYIQNEELDYNVPATSQYTFYINSEMNERNEMNKLNPNRPNMRSIIDNYLNHIVAQPSSAPPSTTTTNSNKHGPKEPAYEDTTMRRSKRHLSSYATMNNSNNNPNNGMNMYNYNQQSMVSNKRELQNNKRVKLSH